MRCVKLVVVATLSVVLTACSGFEEVRQDRAHRSARSKAPASGQTYYAGADGLVVRDQPSASGTVIGRLALHERVTRVRTHDGFALVTGSASGVKGWVENAQLVAHIPAASPATKEAPPAGATPDVPRAAAFADPDPGPPPVSIPPGSDPEPAPVRVLPAKPAAAAPKPEMLDPF
jgi:hypothetical protein